MIRKPDPQKLLTSAAIKQEAARLGVEVWELTLTMISQSPQELKRLTLAFHREVSEMVEMPWKDYCTLNGITE